MQKTTVIGATPIRSALQRAREQAVAEYCAGEQERAAAQASLTHKRAAALAELRDELTTEVARLDIASAHLAGAAACSAIASATYAGEPASESASFMDAFMPLQGGTDR